MGIDDIPSPERTLYHSTPHYYGDILRRFFIAGAFALLLPLPFYPDLIPPFSVLGMISLTVIIVLFAGITNPRQQWVIWGDLIIAAGVFVLFEYYAVMNYQTDSLQLTVIRSVIALLALVSLYYSAKTIRGMIVR